MTYFTNRCPKPWLLLLVLLHLPSMLVVVSASALYENERVDEYYNRNHTWPPLQSEYTPNTEGWHRISERRFKQVDMLTDDERSYDGYMSSIHSGLLCPNYTEFGWGLTRPPNNEIWHDVNNFLMSHAIRTQKRNKNGEIVTSIGFDMNEDIPEESMDESITTLKMNDPNNNNNDNRPLFLEIPYYLRQRVLRAFQPLLESWIGNNTPLTPYQVYGLRIYRNSSEMCMHLDRTDTHVVSAIFHINHDDESEPWPLVIEDFNGNTNAVSLEPGDVLLYESSKCFHGRPERFNGRWYTSLFIHMYPTNRDINKSLMDTHYRVPPTWRTATPSSSNEPPVDKLQMVDTCFREPNCVDEWCPLKDAVRRKGPAPSGYGEFLTGNNEIRKLNLNPNEILKNNEL